MGRGVRHGSRPAVRARRDHCVDLERATAFSLALGFEAEGRAAMSGEFVDDVIGIPGSRSDIVTLRSPDGRPGVELSCFHRPEHQPGSPRAMSTELGIRNVCFEVKDLPATVDRLGQDGYGLVGGVGH